jgi:hypothetical protein
VVVPSNCSVEPSTPHSNPLIRESSATFMYFSRAKYLQFKRRLIFLCALCVSLLFSFRVHLGEKLWSSSLRLLPQAIVLRDGSLADRLAAYFCTPTDQHTDGDPEWDLFYHLGGNGPWIPKVEGVIRGTLAPPAGCDVDQVHMVKSLILTKSLASAQSPMLTTASYLVIQHGTQHRMLEHVVLPIIRDSTLQC